MISRFLHRGSAPGGVHIAQYRVLRTPQYDRVTCVMFYRYLIAGNDGTVIHTPLRAPIHHVEKILYTIRCDDADVLVY